MKEADTSPDLGAIQNKKAIVNGGIREVE